MGDTRGPDPGRAGSASWRVRPVRALGETKPGGSEKGQGEPEQRRELPDASPQLHDLLSEFRLSEVRTIQTDHNRRCRAQPAVRHCELRPAGWHGHDHGPFPHAAQLLEDGGGASEPT